MPEFGDQRLEPKSSNIEATEIECPFCGYNLTGATIGARCPECGARVGDGLIPKSDSPTSPTSLRAVAALMLGAVAVLGWYWFGPWCFLAGPVAVQAALRAKIQAERGEITPSSGRVAHVGLVCGFLGTAAGLCTLVVVMWKLMFG